MPIISLGLDTLVTSTIVIFIYKNKKKIQKSSTELEPLKSWLKSDFSIFYEEAVTSLW